MSPGLLRGSGLQTRPRVDSPGLQGRPAESCPAPPGVAARRGEHAPSSTPKAGSLAANPGLAGRASRGFIHNTNNTLGAGGGLTLAERADSPPPPKKKPPAPRRSSIWAPLPLQPQGAAHARCRPVPTPCRRRAGTPRGVPGGKGAQLTSSSESPYTGSPSPVAMEPVARAGSAALRSDSVLRGRSPRARSCACR